MFESSIMQYHMSLSSLALQALAPSCSNLECDCGYHIEAVIPVKLDSCGDTREVNFLSGR
jgi:hypothetical protein